MRGRHMTLNILCDPVENFKLLVNHLAPLFLVVFVVYSFKCAENSTTYFIGTFGNF